MSHHRVEMKNVSYHYPDGNRGINEVTMLLHHGESVGVIGANGAGKSTLLMLLLGILFPQEGEVVVGDIQVTGKTISLIRQRVGLVMQQADDQLFMTTVYDDIAFGPRNEGLSEDEVSTRVADALKTVGLENIEGRAPYKLSGGEKKSVSIATVLSMEPDILLMDEPTAGLDPQARRRLINLLKCFKHTKIITSHDLDMIMDTCDRVLVLKDGFLVADGNPKELLYSAEKMDAWGLELPLSLANCPNCNTEKNSIL
jgi:cobalt/nickel transport system ATP-binding protein